eukprot:TRINITY_DN31496_c0_g1_i1.p1 TRINITY_DN31496_c0_g1~~TRINITY_DN31496_c0_g1_i1.p1  ORF type:complete len:317 (+),score=76.52 TRINITY_DN31496_c0_g1_i1:119-1069(+)
MELVDLKIVALFVILVEAFCFGLLPLLSKRVPPRLAEVVLGVSNAFAGGIFLSNGFVHLLGESSTLFESAAPSQGEFPLAMFTAATAFLCTFFLEKLFFAHNHSHDVVGSPPPHLRVSREDTRLTAADKEASLSGSEHEANSFAPYALLAVMSVHSFMTGVALGIANDLGRGIAICVGVVVHKWIESFAVGTSLLQLPSVQKSRRQLVMLIGAFAIIGEPLGISVGIGLSSAAFSAFTLVEAILNAIAAGMFIYVAAIDILAEEFSKPKHKYWKAMATLLAFLLMCIISFVLPHSHESPGAETDSGHDHDHDHHLR